MYTRPSRRTTLHFAQRGFTDAFTFIRIEIDVCLESASDAPFAAVGVELNEHLIAYQYADAV